MIWSLITLKAYLVYRTISIFHYCWFNYFSTRFFSCHYYSLEFISGILMFPIDTPNIVIQNWHFWFFLYFLFHELHFTTTLKVLKSVLCFHMPSFYYGVMEVRGKEPTCGCDQNNIIQIVSSLLTSYSA